MTFISGLLLAFTCTVIGLWLLGPALARRLIRSRLKGYRVRYNVVDPLKPERLSQPTRVAIMGGGLAGVVAATTLARRGFTVTIFEANPYLGGKLGSWQVDVGTEREWASHGFHAFFRHYYNLNAFLDSLGLRRRFRSIGDYVVLGRDGSTTGFATVEPTPVLNLISLWRHGTFTLKDVLKLPTRDVMGVFMEYDPVETHRLYDRMSFAQFDAVARLPKALKVSFTTFARAFFSDEAVLSLAEMIKAFHFYYLSHDLGLVYDYPDGDYEAVFWHPIREHLKTLHVTLKLGSPVTQFAVQPTGFLVNGEHFDRAILATDVVGARAIIERAEGLSPQQRAPFSSLRPGQRYAVLKLWLDQDVRQGLPVFVITERDQVLDAFTACHRLEAEATAYVARHGGSVVELHCYAVPESMPDDAVRPALLAEMEHLFPELKGATIRGEHLQLKRDFTAFHVGLYSQRPTLDSGVPGLWCAGDWVKNPFPSMLLEGAATSGLLAANRLLAEAGLREEPVDGVPNEGLLKNAPRPPGRSRYLPPPPHRVPAADE